MKLWILSDLHADSGTEGIGADPPAFDVFVCAGDVVTGNIALSIEMVAALARGKPSVFVRWQPQVDGRSAGGRRLQGPRGGRAPRRPLAWRTRASRGSAACASPRRRRCRDPSKTRSFTASKTT